MRTKICVSPWCKATFSVDDSEISISESGDEILPSKCEGCRRNESYVTWVDKKYDGGRWDGTSHEITYKINKYY